MAKQGKIPKAGPKSHQWKGKKKRKAPAKKKPGARTTPRWGPGDLVTNGWRAGTVVSVETKKWSAKGDVRNGHWLNWYRVQLDYGDGMVVDMEESTMTDA